MLTERDIQAIRELSSEEQSVVMSLVNSFNKGKEINEMQVFLKEARSEYVLSNPMSMEEIDKIIHEEESDDDSN